jgi:predicted unusual protein kinase regulating ubiquinone biosynthesis (AarF/ABC1/UbiB family)
VARVSASWIPGIDMKPIMDELKARVSEELDYRLEATSQRQFADAFRGDERFAVPEVVAGTDHVLVSEWLEGRPLSRVISDGTPAERDAAASRYLEFLVVGPQRAGLLHADPHPGNFRLMPDGRLGVLDFGAVNRLPDGLPDSMGGLLASALDGDHETVVAGLRSEGFIKSSISIDGKALLAYLDPFLDPVREETFRFSRAWLRALFSHINDPRRPQWGVGLKLNLPPEYLLIHRVWLGGIGVLCQIEGAVPARAVLEEHLPGFAPGDVSA